MMKTHPAGDGVKVKIKRLAVIITAVFIRGMMKSKFKVIQGGKKGICPFSIKERAAQIRREQTIKDYYDSIQEICDTCKHYSENNCCYCPEHAKANCEYSTINQGYSYLNIYCDKTNWCCTFEHKTTKKKTCEYWIWEKL